MFFDVSKEKGGRWYVHELGRADSPIGGEHTARIRRMLCTWRLTAAE